MGVSTENLKALSYLVQLPCLKRSKISYFCFITVHNYTNQKAKKKKMLAEGHGVLKRLTLNLAHCHLTDAAKAPISSIQMPCLLYYICEGEKREKLKDGYS